MSFKGKSKRKEKYPLVSLNQEAVKFCFKNNFKIYPLVLGIGKFKVAISKGTKEVFSEEIYSQKTIHQAIADTYLSVYNLNKDKERYGKS